MKSNSCDHRDLVFTSSNAAEAGYIQPNPQQRTAATTAQGTAKAAAAVLKASKGRQPLSDSFPAPLLLPDDDLYQDPDYPPQSLRSWIREKDRNNVTPDRRTIYVAAPPRVKASVAFLQDWASPRRVSAGQDQAIPKPEIQDVVEYLAAFYHGLPVKLFNSAGLSFDSWGDEEVTPGSSTAKAHQEKQKSPRHVGLQTPSEVIGIHARATRGGDFTHQLNLDDILDAAISILPEDAYALLLLVDQDLFEDEEDLFVCGRAYGGSRVAVVSTARYNPVLDKAQTVEREHAWPASHCAQYLQRWPATRTSEAIKNTTSKRKDNAEESAYDTQPAVSPSTAKSAAMRAAVDAHTSLPSLIVNSSARASTPATLSDLWLGRVCRTASHELGHCFGIDHCVYYACAMQGSASITEDARQPPYLCPIDLAKMLKATGATGADRYRALLQFCEKREGAHLFAAFGAWIRVRLTELEG